MSNPCFLSPYNVRCESGTATKILLSFEREESLKTNTDHKEKEFLQMAEQRQAILILVTLFVTLNEASLEIYCNLYTSGFQYVDSGPTKSALTGKLLEMKTVGSPN